jgi:hypothetical protein
LQTNWTWFWAWILHDVLHAGIQDRDRRSSADRSQAKLEFVRDRGALPIWLGWKSGTTARFSED